MSSPIRIPRSLAASSIALIASTACSNIEDVAQAQRAAAPPAPIPRLPAAACQQRPLATPLPPGANNAAMGGNWKETTDGEDIWNPGGHYVQVNNAWQWSFGEVCSGTTLVETNPQAQIAGMANAPNHPHHIVGAARVVNDWQGNRLPVNTVYGEPWICDCWRACTDLGHAAGTCVVANYPGDALNAAVRVSAKCECGVACGTPGQPCCQLNGPPAFCDIGRCNATTHMCEPCGEVGQGCCDGNTCNGTNVCNGQNVCQPAVPCGGVGQPCCYLNGPPIFCDYGRCNTASFVCEPCGEAGQVCCEGDLCNGDNVCNNNLCEAPMPCGAFGQPCCAGLCNDAGASCEPMSNTCQPTPMCGGFGQPCCAGWCQDPGASCEPMSQTCQPTPMCGGFGQPCCAGMCNEPGASCEPMSQTCQPTPMCGGFGQPCCAGMCSDAGASCEPMSNTCQPTPVCGAFGQPCCAGLCQDPGASCEPMSNTCQPTPVCGGFGQPCCAGLCHEPGASCEPMSHTCQPTALCGALGQPCCAGLCNDTARCEPMSNTCQPSALVCGELGQLCCMGGVCTSTLTSCDVMSGVCL